MAKRLIIEHTPTEGITTILHELRGAGIKAPAGGTVDSVPTILVEDADVSRALHILVRAGIPARIG